MDQTVSSSKGRKWLTNSIAALTSNEEFNAVQHLPKTPVAEVIEVSIPSGQKFHTEAIHQQLQGIGQQKISNLAQLEIPAMTMFESDNAHHEIVFVNIPKLGEDAAVAKSLNNLADLPTTHTQSGVPDGFVDPATQETAVDQSVEEKKMESNLDVAEASASPTKFIGGQLGILVEKILDRFPLASPTVLLFVGGEANPIVEETCGRVASALASCHVGRVLLVDGDVEGRQLTIAGGLSEQPGLSEAINRSQDWRPMVVSQDSASFSILPAGNCPMDRWNSAELLREVSAEIRQEFQFICVAAGDAHAKHAKIWCDVCDGSYLVVSMKNSNETFAKSAVQELTSNGA
ncbi:hypothetical protein OAG71_04135, partial [bacterium]|nr:hypothetical protein [bacterium]